MGRADRLSSEVQARIVPGLASCPTSLVFLARDGADYVGVAVCFLGFSTFSGQALVNVHDLAVTRAHRGRGIGRQLLRAVERRARDLGSSKMTLEVRCDNERAQRLYASVGFRECAPSMLFWYKPL